MPSLDHILRFADLIGQLRAVERAPLVRGSERRENDVEHSYSLAMLAWYVNSTYLLGLDTEKLLRYALAHDLVEVHAGDTFSYHADEAMVVDKKKREAEAMEKLKEEYSEFPAMYDAIQAYEAKEDPESRFVYALDKIEPILHVYLDRGRSWHKEGITLATLKEMKKPKVAIDPTSADLFQELVERLSKEEETLFPKYLTKSSTV